LSIKVLDFINWTIVYILVSEGKHYLYEGKDIILKLKSKTDIESNLLDKDLEKKIIDLLNSESNYEKTEQSGILITKENNFTNTSQIKHIAGSYVLITDLENTKSITFKSNVECAEYFEVSKVTIGRWIKQNTYITTKKGVYLFKRIHNDIE